MVIGAEGDPSDFLAVRSVAGANAGALVWPCTVPTQAGRPRSTARAVTKIIAFQPDAFTSPPRAAVRCCAVIVIGCAVTMKSLAGNSYHISREGWQERRCVEGGQQRKGWEE